MSEPIEGRELFRVATEPGGELFIQAFQQAIEDAREEGRRQERERCVAICRDAPFHEGRWLADEIETKEGGHEDDSAD